MGKEELELEKVKEVVRKSGWFITERMGFVEIRTFAFGRNYIYNIFAETLEEFIEEISDIYEDIEIPEEEDEGCYDSEIEVLEELESKIERLLNELKFLESVEQEDK